MVEYFKVFFPLITYAALHTVQGVPKTVVAPLCKKPSVSRSWDAYGSAWPTDQPGLRISLAYGSAWPTDQPGLRISLVYGSAWPTDQPGLRISLAYGSAWPTAKNRLSCMKRHALWLKFYFQCNHQCREADLFIDKWWTDCIDFHIPIMTMHAVIFQHQVT